MGWGQPTLHRRTAKIEWAGDSPRYTDGRGGLVGAGPGGDGEVQ
jgi:hypothetical protein